MTATLGRSKRFATTRLLAVLLSLMVMMAAAMPASAADGEIVETSDGNVSTAPYQTGSTGSKKVTATLDNIPMDCPTGFSNCQLQARLVSKGTYLFATWYEHPYQYLTSARTSWTLTARHAGGNHHWKVQSRLAYQASVTSTAKVCVYHEYSQSISGKIAKAIAKLGASIGAGASYCYNQEAARMVTKYTEWTDVDQSSGTIYTDR